MIPIVKRPYEDRGQVAAARVGFYTFSGKVLLQPAQNWKNLSLQTHELFDWLPILVAVDFDCDLFVLAAIQFVIWIIWKVEMATQVVFRGLFVEICMFAERIDKTIQDMTVQVCLHYIVVKLKHVVFC